MLITTSATQRGHKEYAMSKSTKLRTGSPVASQTDSPVAEPDAEVLTFRAQFDERSPLDQIVRDGAQRMLQTAIEAEVDEFLLAYDGFRGVARRSTNCSHGFT